MPNLFKDKVVVVSGASRGIGFAIAEAFARSGAQTVLAASSDGNLAAAARGSLWPMRCACQLGRRDARGRVPHPA